MKEVRLPAKRKEQRKRASRWLVVTVSFLFLSPLLPAQAPQAPPVLPFLGVTAVDRFGVEARHLALGRRLPWLTAGADVLYAQSYKDYDQSLVLRPVLGVQSFCLKRRASDISLNKRSPKHFVSN